MKYFRTWGGSVAAVEHLVEIEAPLTESDVVGAVDAAAERLHNTRAVCRRAYVHPRLTDDLDEPRLREAWKGARRTEHLSRGERALVRLLEDEQPDAGR